MPRSKDQAKQRHPRDFIKSLSSHSPSNETGIGASVGALTSKQEFESARTRRILGVSTSFCVGKGEANKEIIHSNPLRGNVQEKDEREFSQQQLVCLFS